jgi:hypothetical protein
MYKGWAIKSSPCTATFNDLLCFPFQLNKKKGKTRKNVPHIVKNKKLKSTEVNAQEMWQFLHGKKRTE